jgi:hypothetical protein
MISYKHGFLNPYFQVIALPTRCNLTKKAPGQQKQTHRTAVRQIAYRREMAHSNITEMSCANRAAEIRISKSKNCISETSTVILRGI